MCIFLGCKNHPQRVLYCGIMKHMKIQYIFLGCFLFLVTGVSSVFAEPLILTENLDPGDFSREVVDLQNFYNLDQDTVVLPSNIGEFGVETINATARFQNKYQRTILSPFKRLSTGSVGVMTRFKIAVLGIRQDPNSLRDSENRADLKVLLEQTIGVLNNEIAIRNGEKDRVDNTSQGDGYRFRGKLLPQDVIVGRPGRYEVSDLEGFYVNQIGERYHYELPETTNQPPEQFTTFDDLYQSYDYLTELQGRPIITPVPDPDDSPTSRLQVNATPRENNQENLVVSPSTPIGQAPAEQQVETVDYEIPNNIPAAFASRFDFESVKVVQVPESAKVDTISFPILLNTLQYGHKTGSTVRVFGRGFTPDIQFELMQNGSFYDVTTSYVSSTEAFMVVPSFMSTGVVALGIQEVPHSAVEMYVVNPRNCRRDDDNDCVNMRATSFEGDVVFDQEITIKGKYFDTLNTVETSAGIYYDVPAVDSRTIKLTLEYPFTVGEESIDHDMPFGVRVMNRNGISRYYEGTAEYKKEVSILAQQNRGVRPDGAQAKNNLLEEYLKSKGQVVAERTYGGLVQRAKSIMSQRAFDAFTQQQIVYEEGLKEGMNFLERGLAYVSSGIKKVFQKTGVTEVVYASTLPQQGYITASFPCTCSANWYSLVVGSYGAYPLVVQPGYSMLWANFMVFRPGAATVGSWTPIPGTCWLYVGVSCVVMPTVGIMDPFPGTGTSI